MEKKLHMVSLGCAKNLTDTEMMLAALLEDGFEYVEEPEEADIIVINTCAFIEDAKKESIDNILELAQYKSTGALIGLIVTGCLPQRYGDDVLKEMPEVDAVLGTGSYGDIVEVADKLLDDAEAGKMGKITRMGDISAPICEAPRIQTTPFYTAYIKIAEGCDNCCAYCVIPSIRGRYRSRTVESICGEAHVLAENGVRELVVVAQDITAYGSDIYGEPSLPRLLNELCKVEGIEWIRLHYLYPDEFTDELIDVIASQPKILKYLDIPIQHVSNSLLVSMNRRYTRSDVENLIEKIREKIPGVILRTSLIVGLPGETDEDFAQLCDFVKKIKIERAGIFTYSREEGTQAFDMPDQVDEELKSKRMDILAGIEEEVIAEYNNSLMGRPIEVLVEGYDRVAGCGFGRSYGESPDIDGKIFFMVGSERPEPGDMVSVVINDAIDGDPIGELETKAAE